MGKITIWGLLLGLSLLSIIAAIFAIRSFWTIDYIARETPQHRYVMCASNGRLVFQIVAQDPRIVGNDWDYDQLAKEPEFFLRPAVHLLGFEYETGAIARLDNAPGLSYHSVLAIPLWPFVLIGMASVGIPLRSDFRRRKRIADGLCLQCGYDLRARHTKCGASVA